jgi:hypothetical protein
VLTPSAACPPEITVSARFPAPTRAEKTCRTLFNKKGKNTDRAVDFGGGGEHGQRA